MKIKQNLLLGFFIVFSFESIAEKLSNNLSTQTFTQEEVKDSTIKTPNYKWEVAFGLPKSFDKIERLGQYLILKRPFTNKNGKLRAFRYALNFNVTSFEQELIIGNTKKLLICHFYL